MPAGTEATAVARPVKKAPAFGAVIAAPACRRPLTREPPASDTVSRKGSTPHGRDASAARFTRARSAASGRAKQKNPPRLESEDLDFLARIGLRVIDPDLKHGKTLL